MTSMVREALKAISDAAAACEGTETPTVTPTSQKLHEEIMKPGMCYIQLPGC